MRVLIVEIENGRVGRVTKGVNSPQDGVIIVNHDEIKKSENKLFEAEKCFYNFYREGSVASFEGIKKEILNEYS